MKIIHLLLFACAGSLITACASTPHTTYNPNESKALNITRAAGIDEDLKDVELPRETYDKISKYTDFKTATIGLGYNAPFPGLSGNQMVGLGIFSLLLSPERKANRNSLFAWIPSNVSNPRDKLADILLDAAEKAANEIGLAAKTSISKKGKSGVSVTLTGSDECKDFGKPKELCWIAFGITKASKNSNTPNFIMKEQSKDSWFFDPSKRTYSRYVFNEHNKRFNQVEFLLHVSKYLPEGVYFYVAPNELQYNENKKLKVPVIISEGEILHFIHAAS